jgi:glycosyltransferase involved in cell wall biosynthesis
MRVAFYAPMKPPTSLSPSGDRTIGRLLVQALEVGGATVTLASTLRTWSGKPEPARLTSFRDAAAAERDRLVGQWGGAGAAVRPDVWFTYHNHYKAPDLVGPAVAKALSIPYVIAEASYSARRGDGPWADWVATVASGIKAAQLIYSFTERDEDGVRAIVEARRLRRLAPFISDVPPPAAYRAQGGARVRLVCVAMMREGAKVESYRLLAAALARLGHRHWTLDVVGDGTKADEVQHLLRDACGERVRFHGRLEGAALAEVLAGGDLFVWPGLAEAFGMAYLEAQAHGLPVAACDTAGVGEVVRAGVTGLLAARTTPAAFAEVIEPLIASPRLRVRLGDQARTNVLTHHSIASAARLMAADLGRLVRGA